MASSWCGTIAWADCDTAEHGDCATGISHACYLPGGHPEVPHWNPTIGHWLGDVETDLRMTGRG